MPTPLELLRPLRPGLIPVPAIQPGICPVCRTATKDGFDDCYLCASQTVSVVPISLSVHLGHLHHHLRNYKDHQLPDIRKRFTLRLAALLEVFLYYHLDSCLGGPVDRVATVPSIQRDAPWQIILRLTRFRGQTNPLTCKAEGELAVTADIREQRVLLVEDTFASGDSLFAAHQALTDAGAIVAGPVVLGRHMQPGWPPSKELLKRLESARWDSRRCCICAGITLDPPLRGDSTSLFGQS